MSELSKLEQCYLDSMLRYWEQSKAYDMRETLKMWQELGKGGNRFWRAYKEACRRISLREGK